MTERQKIERRFWSKVRKTDNCWYWQIKQQDAVWYGQFKYDGKLYGAHRVAWLLSGGTLPDGLWILRKCNNPACVRPDHLYLGTHLDNVRDLDAKRAARNQPQPASKWADKGEKA